ncbi:hypothetical protein [Paenibacillus sp. EKM212P]|uniref:hypothetical protein n=1 Tax=Paenibacillus sp. EKM212P TaxID=1683680 RepID=UPI001EEB644A|nr:hypothetical protein [Paenibacillus sp. EKM212P]
MQFKGWITHAKKPHAPQKQQARGRLPLYYPPNIKRSDFTAIASGAEDLNLEKQSARLCHGILTFSCLSNPKNPVATAIVRSNPSRSGSLQPP